jgi:hypothetical protein
LQGSSKFGHSHCQGCSKFGDCGRCLDKTAKHCGTPKGVAVTVQGQ